MKQIKRQWYRRLKAFAISGMMLAGCVLPVLPTLDTSADAYTDAGVSEPTYSANLAEGGGTYEGVLGDGETSVNVGTTKDTRVGGVWMNSIPTGSSASIVDDNGNAVLKLSYTGEEDEVTTKSKGWVFASHAFATQGEGNYFVEFDYYNPTGAANAYMYLLNDSSTTTTDTYGEYDETETNLISARSWLNFEAGTAIEEKEGWYHFEYTINVSRRDFNAVYFKVWTNNLNDNIFYVDNLSVQYAIPTDEAYSSNLVEDGGTFEGVLTDSETSSALGTSSTNTVAGAWTNTNWADSPGIIIEDSSDSDNSVIKLGYVSGAGGWAHAIFNFENRGAGKYLLEFDYYHSNDAVNAYTSIGKVSETDVATTEDTWSGAIYDDASKDDYMFSAVTYSKTEAGVAITEKTGWYHFSEYVEIDSTQDIFRIYAWTNKKTANYLLIDNVSLKTVKPVCDDDTYFDWTVNFGHSASFHNNLTMNYYVPTSDLTDYENYYLSVEKDVWNDDGSWTTETTRLNGESTADGYKFVFSGIAAAEAGNELRATLYAEADGKTFKSQIDAYSVKEYAYDRLAASDDEAFKTLLVDMLNYCSAAQTYFGVNADNLVNADLTEEQKALATADDALNLSDNSSAVALDGATAQIVGRSIVFNSNVEVKFYMDLSAYSDLSGITLSISYTDVKGQAQTLTKEASEFVLENGYYTVKMNELNVADLGQVFTTTIMKDDVAISDSVNYSVESYVYNRLENSENEAFKSLIKELMKYSVSAKNYFA